MGHATQLAQSWANALEESLSTGLARIRAEVVAVSDQDVTVVRGALQILVEWKLRGTLKVALLHALKADAATSVSGPLETEQIAELRARVSELREALRSREHQDRADHASRARLDDLEKQRTLLSTQTTELAESLALMTAGETALAAAEPAAEELKLDRMRDRDDVHTERQRRELDQSSTRTARATD